MHRARSVLVGLTQVDPEAYGREMKNGVEGCEKDVDAMEGILRPLGYDNAILKTAEATAGAVLDALRAAAAELEEGDIFVFFYSGHGGQQPDENGDEQDGKDETMVLYDRQVIDDELNDVWLSFKPGVRIVMLSDSCNSGTNYRAIMTIEESTPMEPLKPDVVDMQARMIHVGGCRDGFYSIGLEDGGIFTKAVVATWDKGSFEGNYQEFFDGMVSRITTTQRPQMNEYGPVDDAFRNQRPFTVDAGGAADDEESPDDDEPDE